MTQSSESVVYDSTPDTLAHIARVAELLEIIEDILAARASVHDASKLVSPEKEAFDAATPKLRALTYGSPEYDAARIELGEALAHHYAHNSHHPEFYPPSDDKFADEVKFAHTTFGEFLNALEAIDNDAVKKACFNFFDKNIAVLALLSRIEAQARSSVGNMSLLDIIEMFCDLT